MLLVTGGPPSGQCFNPSDCQIAINKVDDLKNKIGVTTYIVGMGDQTNDGCLQAMANDEGSAQFYSPASHARPISSPRSSQSPAKSPKQPAT